MKKSLILLAFLVCSCGITKKINKKKVDTTEKEEIVQETKREGDTVTFYVPKLILKDTTIYTVNRVGTRIETRYNNDGQIDRIDCMSSAIEELTKIIREKETNVQEKEKDEEFKMDQTFIIGVLVIFALLIVYVVFRVEGIRKVLP